MELAAIQLRLQMESTHSQPLHWHSDQVTEASNNFQFCSEHRLICKNCLVGLVVKASASIVEDLGSNPACAGIFSGSSHTSDLKIGIPVATLPGAWCDRVSAGTGWPGVSIL